MNLVTKVANVLAFAGVIIMITSNFSTIPSVQAQFLPQTPPQTLPDETTAPPSNATTTTTAPPSNATTTTTAPPSNATRGAGYNVFVQLFGIDNAKGDIITFATAQNGTRNVTEIDTSSANDLRAAKFPDRVSIFFTNMFTKVGDKISACSIMVDSRSLNCNTVFRSPGNGDEFMQVVIPNSK
jgi:hypothetical protein